MQTDLVRVSRRHPCPICGKTDWCSFNQHLAICMRIQGTQESKNGGWVHYLGNNNIAIPPQPILRPKSPRANDYKLDKIYCKLLSALTLNNKHINHLKDRGMSLKEIKWGMYKTLPGGNWQQLVSSFSIQEAIGVPGFGYKNNRLYLSGKAGLLIPVISDRNQIVSLTIRPDHPQKGKKYIVMSSRWLKYGSSPGARIHVATPPNIKQNNTVWITEGPLKANIAAVRLQQPVIAVPGVSNWKDILRMQLPKTIIMAYDSDYENYWVRYHARKLTNILLRKGHRVIAALWQGAKGLDDALVANKRIKFIPLKIGPIKK